MKSFAACGFSGIERPIEMNEIQLFYARTIVSPQKPRAVPEFEFAMLVKNLAFAKEITVHWTGDDKTWQTLPAEYACRSGLGRELWQARTSCGAVAGQLPGTVRFALQYRVRGRTYWDNNHTLDYVLAVSAGVLLGPDARLAHLGYSPAFSPGETDVAVAVDRSLQAKSVFVRWTGDNWKTWHQSSGSPLRTGHLHAGEKHPHSSAAPDSTVWRCRIKTRKASRIEYAIGCTTETGEIWDNNLGVDYTAIRAGLKILTLNLHCCQEDDQDDKFNEIVRAIHELDIDIVCLQEVGERWCDGEGDWQSNSARIICERLRKIGRYYHLFTDWSHIGFDRYREGSAILSKYKFLKHGAEYVSTSRDIHTIHARKVVMGQIDFPGIGPINVFSVHLSWWEDGFRQQFEKLRQWADDAQSGKVVATLLCGDFNSKAGSKGYMTIADGKEYEDQFLRAASPAVFAKVFRKTTKDREEWLADDNRIDYIFTKKSSTMKPKSATVLFTGHNYRRVSDHPGYLVEFEP
jgi:maltose 6'-phosphate phosphatase